MLRLKNIVKVYDSGGNDVTALKGINIEFRKNEFVSILGHSGCGKTTLLNIIGGLDHYTNGDLIIDGVSTKEYRDKDWDTYRNHSIGFVFQSYNLIPHQTVLANVELALTLSGVSKAERTKRARQALEKVGLGDQIKKKPNQLSGGQMQRVAIARALVNDPEILLADEPTGALDSETSVQIMDILKEVAADRLVIMVTHNPELAEMYSTRIVRLIDGQIVSDSMPYDSAATAGNVSSSEVKSFSFANPDIEGTAKKTVRRRASAKSRKDVKGKRSMSFRTALSLSLNNLMTKKARTVLTSFAGSIGIIGIALILSLSSGIQMFIRQIQEDTLSSYPITITSESVQLADILSAISENKDKEITHGQDKIYSSSAMYDMAKAMFNVTVHSNDLKALKSALDSDEKIKGNVSDIQYVYAQTLHIYTKDPKGKLVKVNPSTVMDSISTSLGASTGSGSGMGNSMTSGMQSRMMSGVNVCSEMINNHSVLDSQYDMVAGRWPQSYNEVVLVVDKNNELNDVYMYALGLKDSDEMEKVIKAAMNGEEYTDSDLSFTYEDILNKTFTLVLTSDYYQYDASTGKWTDMSENETYVDYIVKTGVEIKISGIVRPAPDSVAQSISGAIGYTHALSEYVIEQNKKSPAAAAQLADKDNDIIKGLPFEKGDSEKLTNAEKASEILAYFGTLSLEKKAEIYKQIASTPTDAELDKMTENYIKNIDLSNRDMIVKMIMQSGSDKLDGLSEEVIAGYINTMSEEELKAFISSMIRKQIEDQMKAAAEGQLSGLSSAELAAMLDAKLNVTDEGELADYYDKFMPPKYSDSTYEKNAALLGITDSAIPSQINIYASSFEDKDRITEWIENYNQTSKAAGHEERTIKYTDYVGLIMSSVTRIVDIVSIVLIAFVAISLVVSSIMIGVITYISVIERTKEIGILRSIGASKRDITRVFNAETTIIGSVSGAIGIIITLILLIPANKIVEHFTEVPNIAALPVLDGFILIAISIVITVIAGLFPSLIAAKKDPVVALRTE